jgi:hypothetical protein
MAEYYGAEGDVDNWTADTSLDYTRPSHRRVQFAEYPALGMFVRTRKAWSVPDDMDK